MTLKDKKEGKKIEMPNLFPSFRIEADGRGKYMRILISGVLGISELSEEEIKLTTRRESLKIGGKRLSVSIFEGNSVEIYGEVERIENGKAEKRGGKRNGKN